VGLARVSPYERLRALIAWMRSLQMRERHERLPPVWERVVDTFRGEWTHHGSKNRD